MQIRNGMCFSSRLDSDMVHLSQRTSRQNECSVYLCFSALLLLVVEYIVSSAMRPFVACIDPSVGHEYFVTETPSQSLGSIAPRSCAMPMSCFITSSLPTLGEVRNVVFENALCVRGRMSHGGDADYFFRLRSR